MTAMNGRERVQRMFARRDQDRVPHHDAFWTETITRWQGEGLDGDCQSVLDLLGSDFQPLCKSSPAPFPGRNRVVSEDEQTHVISDSWGATSRHWKGRSGTPEHLGWQCETVDDWFKTFRAAMLSTDVQVDIETTKSTFEAGRARGLWCHLAGNEPFSIARLLMGDELSLMAMALEPELIQDISRIVTDLVIRDFDAVWNSGIHADGVWIYGDMAYSNGTLCSPAMYRELILPDHKRLADWAHAHNMHFIFHSDGDVNGAIDLYIEAGFDCLQPLEVKAGLDIRNLCPRYGDNLTFFGNVDARVYETNDIAEIEAEIISKFTAGMATKGYAYHSDHSVPPDVSWATYQEIIKLVEKHGRYE